jgi:uncharacterized protein
MAQIEVVEVPERERYEARVDGALAGFAEFRGHASTRAFTHTEIDERFEGQGVGSALVAAAMEDVRAKGLHVLPICPFVKAWLGRHPEVAAEVVQDRYRAAFGLV